MMLYYSPSVKQNKNTKGKPWRATVYYKDNFGKVRQKTLILKEAKGKKEAQKMADAWCDELNGVMPDSDYVGLSQAIVYKSIKEVIEEYEEHRLKIDEIQKSTYQRDMLVTKNYINPYLGNTPFGKLSIKDINDWVTVLNSKKLSKTTIRNAFTQLKKVYNYYAFIREIEANPFDYVKNPSPGDKRKTHLSVDQANEFEVAVKEEYDEHEPMYSACFLAYYAGMRRGEICGLRWQNVDFDKQEIHIDSAIGIGEGGNYTKMPKNKSSYRTIPMSPQLFEVLKKRYDYVKPESNWFVTGNKQKFMSLQQFATKLKMFMERD